MRFQATTWFSHICSWEFQRVRSLCDLCVMWRALTSLCRYQSPPERHPYTSPRSNVPNPISMLLLELHSLSEYRWPDTASNCIAASSQVLGMLNHMHWLCQPYWLLRQVWYWQGIEDFIRSGKSNPNTRKALNGRAWRKWRDTLASLSDLQV